MERTDYPKIGEQHPEGPRMSPATKTQKDTLNFGWFSLPSAKKDHGSGEERLNSPMVPGGLQESCLSPTNDKRPTSKEGSRPDSQPKSPTAMEPTKGCEAEQSGRDPHEPGFSQRSHGPLPVTPAHDEHTVLDWPLSPLAGRCIVNTQGTVEHHVQPRTPVTRVEPHGPPTPVPPLHWQGYHNSHRPTYTTWQSQVQESRDHQAQNLCSHGWNMNNSNDDKDTAKKTDPCKARWKKAKKIRDKNSNNNNDAEKSRVRDNYSSKKSLISVSNYSADGNNNNWLLDDTEGGASATKYVRTLPPYEYSREVSPTFYSPNVVMKWEDTEQQSNSMQDQQNFKHVSLMKRIRTSLLQMWSLVPCLKNQGDGSATPRSRLFKYDRFDNEKTPKQGS